jgi:hypothetical protein
MNKNLTKIELTKLAYNTYEKIASADLFVTDWDYLLPSERLAWFEVVLVLGEAFRQARDFDSNGNPRVTVRRDDRNPWEGQTKVIEEYPSATLIALKFNDEKDY